MCLFLFIYLPSVVITGQYGLSGKHGELGVVLLWGDAL